jgi:hypothetical protein
MAYITIVSGGSQPVFATDVLNGPVAQDANIAAQGPVQVAGPKLDFYSFTANVSLASLGTQGAVNEFVANVLQALQQVSTVAQYQVGPSANVISVGLYPVGSFANVAVAVATAQGANGGGYGISSGSNVATFTSTTAAS